MSDDKKYTSQDLNSVFGCGIVVGIFLIPFIMFFIKGLINMWCHIF